LLALDLEAHRHAADHPVGIGVDVERADVALKPDRGSLPGRRQQRTIQLRRRSGAANCGQRQQSALVNY
jgi:hypothetical protein